jgi:hypothetical protein
MRDVMAVAAAMMRRLRRHANPRQLLRRLRRRANRRQLSLKLCCLVTHCIGRGSLNVVQTILLRIGRGLRCAHGDVADHRNVDGGGSFICGTTAASTSACEADKSSSLTRSVQVTSPSCPHSSSFAPEKALSSSISVKLQCLAADAVLVADGTCWLLLVVE